MFDDLQFLTYRRHDRIRKLGIMLMSSVIIFFSIFGPLVGRDAFPSFFIGSLAFISSAWLIANNVMNAPERGARTTHIWMEVVVSGTMIMANVYLFNYFVHMLPIMSDTFLCTFFLIAIGFNLLIYVVGLVKQIALLDLIYFT